LIEKIESITKTETISKSTENYKPSLLILDEVDGTTESEYSVPFRHNYKELTLNREQLIV